jgi:hypothetical protein
VKQLVAMEMQMQTQRMHEKRQRRADDEIAHMNLFNDVSQLDERQLRINDEM